MKPTSEMPGLFDFEEPAPLPTIAESRAAFEKDQVAAQCGPDPAKFRHARHPGHCFAELKFWTGRVACEEGARVEIETTLDGSTAYVREPRSGHMIMTFLGANQMDEFRRHFCIDDGEGGAA